MSSRPIITGKILSKQQFKRRTSPPNDLEAAILAPVAAGNYTAVLSGNGGGTGIGLVEVYKPALMRAMSARSDTGIIVGGSMVKQ